MACSVSALFASRDALDVLPEGLLSEFGGLADSDRNGDGIVTRDEVSGTAAFTSVCSRLQGLIRVR